MSAQPRTLLRHLQGVTDAKPETISLPSEVRGPCPRCGKSAAVIDVGMTSCCQCGATVRVNVN